VRPPPLLPLIQIFLRRRQQSNHPELLMQRAATIAVQSTPASSPSPLAAVFAPSPLPHHTTSPHLIKPCPASSPPRCRCSIRRPHHLPATSGPPPVAPPHRDARMAGACYGRLGWAKQGRSVSCKSYGHGLKERPSTVWSFSIFVSLFKSQKLVQIFKIDINS
jgi:hypothetical protein